MIVLYILLALIFALFLASFFNVYIDVRYKYELAMWIRVAFLKFQILPQQPKKTKKKNKKPKKQTKKPENSEEKRKNSAFDYAKQKGLRGIINIIKQVTSLAADVFKDLFRRITFTEFSFNLRIAGENAADSAIKHGQICAIIFPALKAFFSVVSCENYDINVNPDFSDTPKTEIDLKATAKIRIYSLLAFAVTKAFKAIKLYLKAKPK